MFRDTAPHHRMPEPTRADEAAADAAYWQERAAERGDACFALAESVASLLDRYPSSWRADTMDSLHRIHALLTEAQAIAEGLDA